MNYMTFANQIQKEISSDDNIGQADLKITPTHMESTPAIYDPADW